MNTQINANLSWIWRKFIGKVFFIWLVLFNKFIEIMKNGYFCMDQKVNLIKRRIPSLNDVFVIVMNHTAHKWNFFQGNTGVCQQNPVYMYMYLLDIKFNNILEFPHDLTTQSQFWNSRTSNWTMVIEYDTRNQMPHNIHIGFRA